MKSFKQFFTEQTTQDKTIVFAYGRFNPPTVGHEKVINKVAQVARKQNAPFVIVPSHSITPKSKNPLTIEQKMSVLKYMVPNSNNIGDFGTTFINVLKTLQQMGYTKAIQIAGSDRQAEFLALVNKYNGKPDPKTGNVDFNFKTFEVLSSGERDPDSDSVEGMSASKLRNLAAIGDFESFKEGMSSSIPDKVKKSVFDIIRKTQAKQ